MTKERFCWSSFFGTNKTTPKIVGNKNISLRQAYGLLAFQILNKRLPALQLMNPTMISFHKKETFQEFSLVLNLLVGGVFWVLKEQIGLLQALCEEG